jgi:beta-glucosidase-like glycosyl hydrolase/CubicO group peptidase (beta-lactamase class C family)
MEKKFKCEGKIAALLILYCLGSALSAVCQSDYFISWKKNKECVQWVDSVYSRLSVDERIGQCIMLPAYTSGKDYNMDTVLKLVGAGKAGSVIFFKGSPTAQVRWTNQLQQAAKVKLMIAIDGEWGLSMRLDSTIVYPKQMALGAIANDSLIYRMGKEIAQQCRRMGIHVNFAPTVDVNNNPNNPVINDRSFGEDKRKVAEKAIQYMLGLQSEKVLACAKHFPGHGDTETDSHHDLPVIHKSLQQLEETELYPFRQLFKAHVGSVMVAHLYLPYLDSSSRVAGTLSPKITTDLLRQREGFEGLVFSDALNMKGVSRFFKPGEVDSLAFIAGNDVLVYSENCLKGIEKIRSALDNGTISEKDLEQRVKRILAYKYLLGLHSFSPIEEAGLVADLNDFQYVHTQEKLYESAVTIVENADSLIPFFTKETPKKVATVSIKSNKNTTFQNLIKQWIETDEFVVENDSDAKRYQTLYDTLANYDVVVASLHGLGRLPAKNYNVSKQTVDFIKKLSSATKVVLVIPGNAYLLSNFSFIRSAIVAYDETDAAQRAAANALMGAIQVSGTLPVSAGTFKSGRGYKIEKPVRLQFSVPAGAGIDPQDLQPLNDQLLDGLVARAMPGCQLVVAHENKVILNRAFGNPTYETSQKVKTTDLYDVASLTKILATTLAVMKLYDERKIDLTKAVKDYVALPPDATVSNIMIRNLLLHQSGLKPFIEFHKAFKDAYDFQQVFRTKPDSLFAIPVAANMFMRKDYKDSIWQQIIHSPVSVKPSYVYSDLNFYLLQKIIENLSGQPLHKYVQTNFYEPMNLTRIGYLPLGRFDPNRIIPTEIDTAFRKQIIHGYVHDPGAAMMGGVAGHAGIFSNAMDVAAVMQMLLNKGNYLGKQLLKPETIALFTKRLGTNSRRALGFDKPEPDEAKPNPCSANTPLSAFGHTGFTGTAAWADPDTKTVFVFLSNRIYPSASNNKIIKMNLRTKLQQIVYKAVRNHEIR